MKNIIYLFLLLGLIFNPLQASSQEKEKYLSSANKSFKKGDYNNAQKALNIYINHYKCDAPDLANKIQQCMTLRKKAEDAIVKQQIADAIEYYRCILSINPNDPIAKKKIADLETSAINDKTGTLVYATKTYDDGGKYVGYFLNNKQHGQGTYYYNNGNRYEGEWKEGKMHGQGVFYWANGDKYVGSFVNDRRQGQGTHYLANGDRYEGEWKEGKTHGQGTYYNKSNNTITKQIWNNGILERNL